MEKTTKTYGPRQAKDAKREADMVWLWSLDLRAAVDAGDLAKVAQLGRVIALSAGDLAAKAKKIGA